MIKRHPIAGEARLRSPPISLCLQVFPPVHITLITDDRHGCLLGVWFFWNLDKKSLCLWNFPRASMDICKFFHGKID